MFTHFALDSPQLKVDPDINNIFLFLMGAVLVMGVGVIVWQGIPEVIKYKEAVRQAKIKADLDIWFDSHKSILHRGYKQVSIPESSLEYYVCKLVFKNPKVYQFDDDVLEAAGERDKKDRAVYFAVDRINNKARRDLGADIKLLKRSKEKTRLNDNYF